MFTVDEDEDSQPVAVVVGGEFNGEWISVKKDNDRNSILKAKTIQYIDVYDGEFQQLPSDEIRILYVSGPSGSGKSTYAANYIKLYKKLYPDAPFFLFSRLENDEVLDKLKPKRIKIDQSLLEKPIELEDFIEGCIVLFDDCCSITDKKVQQELYKIQGQIMEIGRHMNIKCLITSHLVNGNDRNNTRTIMNEMQSLTIFPSSGSSAQIKYCLKTYFGFSPKQQNAIVEMDSRWVTVTKNYPQIVISQHEMVFAKLIGNSTKK